MKVLVKKINHSPEKIAKILMVASANSADNFFVKKNNFSIIIQEIRVQKNKKIFIKKNISSLFSIPLSTKNQRTQKIFHH